MDLQRFMNAYSEKHYGNKYLPHIFAQDILLGFKPAEWSYFTKPPLTFTDQLDLGVIMSMLATTNVKFSSPYNPVGFDENTER